MDHKELLGEATLQIRQFLKVFSTEENDLCVILHADQPSHGWEHDRTVFINFWPYDVAFDSFLNDVWFEQLVLTMVTNLDRAHHYNSYTSI